MTEDDENQGTTEESQQYNLIPADVLDFVGVSAEEAEAYDKERITHEKEVADSHFRGGAFYEQVARDPHDSNSKAAWALPGANFRIEEPQKTGLIPDQIISQFESSRKAEPTTEEAARIKKNSEHINAFITGYADAAFERGNWQAAVNAYDAVMPGGILKSDSVKDKIRALAQSDRMAGVDIARAIKLRIERRPSNEMTAPPEL